MKTANLDYRLRHFDGCSRSIKKKEGNILTDLTLNEYRGVFERELEQILREEARKMYSTDLYGKNSGKVVNLSPNFFGMFKGFSSGLKGLDREKSDRSVRHF